jgi:hypothetical protein
MKALSFSRPWHNLIVWPPCAIAPKDVENRTWPTQYRGRIYVHRAKSWDQDGFLWLRDQQTELGISSTSIAALSRGRVEHPEGAIVGEVDIVDCVTKSASPWFFGPYGFVLANPVAYDKPIPYRGMPGLFDVYLCFQCKTPVQRGQPFCEKHSQVAIEEDGL